MSIWKEFNKGVVKENPIFVMMLGMCPTLAVSTSVVNAIGMGLATTFVLIGSNVIVSMVRNIIPDKIRIPSFIVIIATFVTIVQLIMKGFFPDLDKSLGIFIPLIVVNCIILGRAEAYASKNNVFYSFIDAIGMGLGFTLSLVLIATIREFLGNNTLLNYIVLPGFKPATFFVLAPGGFLVMGLLSALFKYIGARKQN